MGDGKFNRRDFLKGSSATMGVGLFDLSPVEKILRAISLGTIQQAQAAAMGGSGEGTRNYINIMMPGAPSRYVFDQWLRTNETDPGLLYNPMTATQFVNSGGRAVGSFNSYFKYRNLLVPHMFSHHVFNGSGGARPLSELLNHMLVIRGYGTGVDGHPANATVQQSPVGGVPSISGLAADYSQKTFEAIQYPDRGDWSSFASLTGKALNRLYGAPLANLMEGFGKPDVAAASRSVKERNIAAYELAQARLKAYAKSDFPGAGIVAKNFSNASAMMRQGIADVDAFWEPTVAKYRQTILSSQRQLGLAGISDMALISNQDATWRLHVANGNVGLVASNDFDLRTGIQTSTVPDTLAEGLALAEYTLKKGLATSIDLQVGWMHNFSLKSVGGSGAVLQSIPHDAHETGANASLFFSTCFYRGIAAGMLELIDQLKSTQLNGRNIWSNTVIQLMSDFGRSARSDGSGSDHGFNQMVTSVFSGAFSNGPFVVGNISQQGYGGNYQGTMGQRAPIAGYNQVMTTPAAAASTVATLLGASKNPYENLAGSLVRLNGDQLVPLFPGKVVA